MAACHILLTLDVSMFVCIRNVMLEREVLWESIISRRRVTVDGPAGRIEFHSTWSCFVSPPCRSKNIILLLSWGAVTDQMKYWLRTSSAERWWSFGKIGHCSEGVNFRKAASSTCLLFLHHFFSVWSNRSFVVRIRQRLYFSNHCSETERLTWTSSSSLLVKGYPTLFCIAGKHDWPQLGQLQPILMTWTNWWQGLWKQLSSSFWYFCSHQSGHRWMNLKCSWNDGRSYRVESAVHVWKQRRGLESFSVWMQVLVCVCVCLRVGVESCPELICSYCWARAAGVPVPRRSQAASFSQENAFNWSCVTAKQHRHLRDARNVPPHQRTALGNFYICKIKKRTIKEKKGKWVQG